MCIPIRRWVFLWTGFSLSIPRGSWYRSTPKPISPRKLYSLFCLIFIHVIWLWTCAHRCLTVWILGAVKVCKRVCFCVCLPHSFGRLCDMVDHVFPVLVRDEGADFPCSDTFGQLHWSEPLPDSTNQEEEPQPLETSWGNPIKSSTEDAACRLFSTSQSGTTRWFSEPSWSQQPRLRVADYFRIINLSKNCVGLFPTPYLVNESVAPSRLKDVT